jgi:hypothetical protein
MDLTSEPALWLAAIGSIQASSGANLTINITINQRGPEDSLRLWDELIRLQQEHGGKVSDVLKSVILALSLRDYPPLL